MPEYLRKAAFALAHVQEGGHCDLAQTMDHLREFYWPNMKSSVQLMTTSCPACLSTKGFTSNKNNATAPFQIPTRPMDVVHIDRCTHIKGDAVDTEVGEIWAIVDRLSGRMIAREADNSLTSEGLVQKLTDLFNEYGWPSRLIADGDRLLAAAGAQKFLEKNSIVFEPTAKNQSLANGMVERRFRTLEERLAAVVMTNPELWRNRLQGVVSSINNRRDPVTGATPNELFFGWSHRSRGENNFPRNHKDVDVEEARLRRSEKLTDDALEAACAQKANPEFKEGDLVYVQRSTLPASENLLAVGSQLGRRFLGPYKVMKAEGAHVLIQMDDGERKVSVTSCKLLPDAQLAEALEKAEAALGGDDIDEAQTSGRSYVIEEVRGWNKDVKEPQVRVKWKGYPYQENNPQDSEYVPLKNLTADEELVKWLKKAHHGTRNAFLKAARAHALSDLRRLAPQYAKDAENDDE